MELVYRIYLSDLEDEIPGITDALFQYLEEKGLTDCTHIEFCVPNFLDLTSDDWKYYNVYLTIWCWNQWLFGGSTLLIDFDSAESF